MFERPYVDSPPSAVYAACEINCKKDSSVYLLIGSSDSTKVWLNGNIVFAAESKRGLSQYNDSVRLELKRGTNFLLLKVCRWRISWGLTARIEPSAEMAAQTILLNQGYLDSFLLKKSIIPVKQALNFSPPGLPKRVKFSGCIADIHGKVLKDHLDLMSESDIPHTQSLDPGLYQLNIFVDKHILRQPFIIGSVSDYISNVKSRIAALTISDNDKLNYDASILRLGILIKPENATFTSSGDQIAWDKKIVYTLSEITSALLYSERKEEPFAGRTGLHLYGFQSRIDGQTEYYRIFVPSTYDGNKASIPLIILLPTVTSTVRPFIESAFLAAHSEAERISAIADRNNVAVAWCGYRNILSGQPCENTHIEEVIGNVVKMYAIDQSRISLLGACSGGAAATIAVIERPTRFAAVALLNTMWGYRRLVTEASFKAFKDSPGFVEWLNKMQYLPELFKTNGPQFYIIHDGAEPGHGDLQASEYFAKNAAATNYPYRFERRMQTLGQHFGAWNELISWLATQHRETVTDEITPISRSMSPIATAFGDRFVIIRGTGGDEADRLGIERICNQMLAAWKIAQFGNFRVITDLEFERNSDSMANFVLVGNPKTNKVWQMLAPRIPLVVNATEIKSPSKSWQGNDLGLQMIFRNPDDGSHSVVFIGAANLKYAQFSPQNLSAEGWFDYAIWHTSRGQIGLLDAGKW